MPMETWEELAQEEQTKREDLTVENAQLKIRIARLEEAHKAAVMMQSAFVEFFDAHKKESNERVAFQRLALIAIHEWSKAAAKVDA